MPNIYRVNIPEDNILGNENRGGKNPPPNSKNNNHKKKKNDFKTLKSNTIKSLNDVEYFLNNLDKFMKYIKLYKLLK